jgi:hypothetical protein
MSVYFAVIDPRSRVAPANRRIYASPDGHVCECCRPWLAVSGATVAVMFRNWVAGARDPYMLLSRDRGATFGEAQRVGSGTWMLDACPMDGGAFTLRGTDIGGVAWRRERTVYYTADLARETALGPGANPMISERDGVTYVAWQDGPRVRLLRLAGAGAVTGADARTIGEGVLPQVLSLGHAGAVVAWERGGLVYAARM